MTKQSDQQKTGAKSGYANANGLKMYYVIRGTGRPLILLHGGGATEMFLPILPARDSARHNPLRHLHVPGARDGRHDIPRRANAGGNESSGRQDTRP